MSDPGPLQLGERLMAAIASGDVAAVRDIYAPDAVIWHNNDGKAQTVDENLAVLAWVVRNIADLRYEEIRRQHTDSGFVQQHVLRGRAPNGTPLEVRACLVCDVERGRITRLAEYVDTAHLAPLLARS